MRRPPHHARLAALSVLALVAPACDGGESGGSGFALDVLVDTAELEGLLGRPDTVVIDARSEEDYARAHLPGAVRLGRDMFRPNGDLDRVLAHKAETGFAVPAQLAEDLFGRAGIDERSTVVVYDGPAYPDASAVWATLTYFGHRNVRVLDGGFGRWVWEGKPVTTERPTPAPRRFEARPDPSMVASRAFVVDHLDGALVLDMRSLGEYAGIDAAGLTRGGHIPGAINVDWRELAGDGTVRPPDELRRILRDKGVDDVDRDVVTYCNVGVGRATYGLMVLRALGFERVRAYGGSFEDWADATNRPVATATID